jgi:transposase
LLPEQVVASDEQLSRQRLLPQQSSVSRLAGRPICQEELGTSVRISTAKRHPLADFAGVIPPWKDLTSSLRRYRRRWKIERLFAWWQNFRRLVVRYERHAKTFSECLILSAA